MNKDMNFTKASPSQLREIAYNSDVATLADRAAARNELFRRGRKRSGKLTMHGKEMIKR